MQWHQKQQQFPAKSKLDKAPANKVMRVLIILITAMFVILVLVMSGNSKEMESTVSSHHTDPAANSHIRRRYHRKVTRNEQTGLVDIFQPTVPRLAVVFPYHSGALEEVYESLTHWTHMGHPCPSTMGHADLSSAVDLVFLYNFEQTKSSDFPIFKKRVLTLLAPVAACFDNVKFVSANIAKEQDEYPFGPTYMFYAAMLSHIDNFSQLYDYMFWHEADVLPIRPGWLDKLLYEVTFDGEFYVKGSLYREEGWGRSKDAHIFYGHINGNALYKLNDDNFNALLQTTKDDVKSENKFLDAFDVAFWIHHLKFIPNDKEGLFVQSKFKKVQELSHLYKTSPFIMNFAKVHWRKPYSTSYYADLYPNTYFIHGQNIVKDATHPPVTLSESSKRTHHLDPEADQKLVVVYNVVEKQLPMLVNTFQLSVHNPSLNPCASYSNTASQVDLAFSVPRVWTPGMISIMNDYQKQYPEFFSCFKKVLFIHIMLDEKTDKYASGLNSMGYSGPNNQFYKTFDVEELKIYSHMLLLEPDTLPVQGRWVERFIDEAVMSTESFWIKGTAYRGHRVDWLKQSYGTNKDTLWGAMNGNAVYNLHDKEFRSFRESVRDKYPALPYDVAFQAYLTDFAEVINVQTPLTKIHYSSFVQNYGGTPYTPEVVVRNSPDTYFVHSKCRMDGSMKISEKLLYCYVCRADEAYSPTCWFKLNSLDLQKGHGRFSVGPDYKGQPLEIALQNGYMI